MNLTEFIPPLRKEIRFEHAGAKQDTFNIIDELNLSTRDLIADEETKLIAESCNGELTIFSLRDSIEKRIRKSVDVQQLISLISILDENHLLQSSRFESMLKYVQSSVHQPICNGISYSDDPSELNVTLRNSLLQFPANAYPQNAVAAFIPHIDLRLGYENYTPVFNCITKSEFDVVIHIGTSHYGYEDRFILSEKNFETTLGNIENDVELVKALRNSLPFDLTKNDSALQHEHSFEFHHLVLKHLFPNKPFTVLPILVTSFHDFIQDKSLPEKDKKVKTFCKSLFETVHKSGKKPLWIVSGDLSHIGKKFGDDFDPREKQDALRYEDYLILDSIVKADSRDVHNAIAAKEDSNRICGYPPVYTLLQTLRLNSGIALNYNQWYEEATQSLVSFGSVAWF